MLLRDLVATSWQNLWVHRLRAILSILGIIIGIASFSIMQSVGEGARQETIRIMKELGSDVLTLTQNVNPSDPGSKPNRPTIEDIRNGLKGSLAISAVSGKFSEQVELPLQEVNEVEVHPAAGVTANFCQMFKLEPASGRLPSDFDFESRNPVCILGNVLSAAIFPGENPLDKKIAINGQLFDIIGVRAGHAGRRKRALPAHLAVEQEALDDRLESRQRLGDARRAQHRDQGAGGTQGGAH